MGHFFSQKSSSTIEQQIGVALPTAAPDVPGNNNMAFDTTGVPTCPASGPTLSDKKSEECEFDVYIQYLIANEKEDKDMLH